MSVSCAVAFADKVVTRMTVNDGGLPNSLDIGRALRLASYAYESRMKRPPPERDIPIAGKTYRLPHILGLRYWTDDGKSYDISEGELVRSLIFAMIFSRPKP